MKNGGYFIIGIFVILAIEVCITYATGFDPFTPKGSTESKKAIGEFIGDPPAIVVFEKSAKNILGDSYDTYRVNVDKFIVGTGSGSVIGASFFSVPMTTDKNILTTGREQCQRVCCAPLQQILFPHYATDGI